MIRAGLPAPCVRRCWRSAFQRSIAAAPMSGEVGESGRFSSYWRDVAWQSSGSSLAQLVGIAGLPVLTRLYAPEEFAVQSLFLQVVTYATALVTWRYEYFIQLPKLDADVRALNRLVLVLGCITVLAFTPLLWVFRNAFAVPLGNPDVAPWLFLAPATAVFFSWAVAAQNNAQRHADFRTSGLSELVGKLAYVSTGIVGALLHPGAVGLMITTAVAALGKSGFVLLRWPTWLRSPLRPEVDSVRSVQRHYGRLATSTVISHVLSTSAFAIPQIAIARLYGADVLGQFALALATVFLPSGLIGGAIGQVYYQRAAKQWADGSAFLPLWGDMVRKLLMIGVPIYAAVALLSEAAYPFVFGAQWHLAGEFAGWMALAAFVSFVSSPMDRTCLIVGAASYSIVWSIYRLLSTVVLVWLASALDFSPMSFVIAFIAQLSLTLGVDMWMSCRFSQGRLNFFGRY
jgi:teichuronic acid exporter